MFNSVETFSESLNRHWGESIDRLVNTVAAYINANTVSEKYTGNETSEEWREKFQRGEEERRYYEDLMRASWKGMSIDTLRILRAVEREKLCKKILVDGHI